MRFVGRVAIILVLTIAAAAAHSMYWPIYRDLSDERARKQRPRPDVSAIAAPDPATPDAPVPPTADEDLPDHYISIARAYQLWEEGMPFVDARTNAERVVGTIEGAIHIETRNFIDGSATPLLDELDRAFPVIVFCGGGECDASENVALRLSGWGFEEVYVMHEGFGAWKDAGHPTEAVGGG